MEVTCEHLDDMRARIRNLQVEAVGMRYLLPSNMDLAHYAMDDVVLYLAEAKELLLNVTQMLEDCTIMVQEED